MDKELTLHPRDLGPRLKHRIRELLCAEVEGKSLGKYGYVVKVENISEKDTDKGKIDSETGMVSYNIKFFAIVFRPFRLEVVDAVVGKSLEILYISMLNFFEHSRRLS